MGSKKCPPGCGCGRHQLSENTIQALRNRKGVPAKKCEKGCTCGHHRRTDYKKCEPGCTCKRHEQTDEHRRRNSEANRGRRRSPDAERRRAEARGAITPEQRQAMSEGRKRAIAADPSKTPGFLDGRCRHPHYTRWYNMVARCTKPHHPMWPHYGGRGITVCDEWLNPHAFYAYLDEVLGPCPADHSLDRIDNDGGYEPGNVRWASRSQQWANQRHTRVYRSYDEEARRRISEATKAGIARARRV